MILLAWWFIQNVVRGEVMGPFGTKAQCDEVRTQLIEALYAQGYESHVPASIESTECEEK